MNLIKKLYKHKIQKMNLYEAKYAFDGEIRNEIFWAKNDKEAKKKSPSVTLWRIYPDNERLWRLQGELK